ncbi:MAG TPA: ABC transporter ATP-binding protein [Thermoleophilia bacterium]|nr:ABC transporter ATP-binding protein [Thermoleophilia bacterium]
MRRVHTAVDPAVEVRGLSRHFGTRTALRDVSISVSRGEIHSLLGPNGAGKTTLLRILAGLTRPSAGTAHVLGLDILHQTAVVRGLVGVIPPGDRTFYQRLSGLENLIFFGRLYGLGFRDAMRRARETLEAVGLTGQEHLMIGKYSQGMQKRLAIARALLTDPAVFLIDEATHNLDPEGARLVRELIRNAADRGAGVVWATQRVEEIRGFADTVTLLHRGEVRFTGTTAQLVSLASPTSFLLRIRNGGMAPELMTAQLRAALGGLGVIAPDAGADGEHYVMTVANGSTLGAAIGAISRADLQVLSCHETRPEIEQAFVELTEESPS